MESQSPFESGGRKAEAFAFIQASLLSGLSPSIDEIGAALGVSKTRAKTLVKKLDDEGLITRTPGSQRGIAIPDLFHSSAAIAELRSRGYTVFSAGEAGETFPKEHVGLIAILDHEPEPDRGAGDGEDESSEIGGSDPRRAARCASRVRPAGAKSIEAHQETRGRRRKGSA